MIKLGKRFWPRGRAGGIAMVVVLLGGGLAATIGAGYTVARPLLSDGSEFLARGRTVVHVNGESGQADAELARELAAGKEGLVTVRLPDGRLAVVNTDTGQVSFYDATTMDPLGPGTDRPDSKGMLETLPTRSHVYLVDRARDVIEEIDGKGNPGKPVRLRAGIEGAVPSGDSIWVVTGDDKVVEVAHGRTLRTMSLGDQPLITVADGHPVVVVEDGGAYAVDGVEPRLVGRLDLPANAVLGSWRGPGRYIVGVDKDANRVVALDPRTGDPVTVDLPVAENAPKDWRAPVQLGNRVYVPNWSGPVLWKVELSTRHAEALAVPGQPGPIELKVSGEQVWANSQYDQRALLIDKEGVEKRVDKGAGNGSTDSERAPNPDERPHTEDPKPTGAGPQPGEQSGPPSEKQVAVPAFARGVTYQEACAELRRVELDCESVAAGDAPGLGSDEVINTNPPAGSRVPAGTRVLVRYVGPVRVPNVLDLDKDEACAIITAAGLKCEAEPDTRLADTPEKLLKVSGQDPSDGEDIDKGDTVRIRYPDTITLPSFVGKPYAQACNDIDFSYRMKCNRTAGAGPANICRTSGAVFQQNPPADTTAKAGSTIDVTFCQDGTVLVPDYGGQNATEACKKATDEDGLSCHPLPGDCGQPGIVYAQNPPANTQHDPQIAIQLTHYIECKRVPDLRNWDPDLAKDHLDGMGFTGEHHYVLAPNYRVVNYHEFIDETIAVGRPIKLHWSPWQSVEFSVVQDGIVRVLQQGAGGRPIGRAYTETFPPSLNLRQIREFSCEKDTECIAFNRFYSHAERELYWYVSNQTAMWLLPFASGETCADGQHVLYRVWRNPDRTREYSIELNHDGWPGWEALGCAWS